MPPNRSGLTVLLIVSLIVAQRAQGQGLPPTFRPSDGRDRAARILANIQSMERDLDALRRVLVDTTTGTTEWVEFEPTALARVLSGTTPEAAANAFIAAYALEVLGTELAPTDLLLTSTRDDGALTHLRYAQRFRGRPVSGGELLVHVARVNNRFVVQSLNGRVYAGIDVVPDPTLTFEAARDAAEAVAQGTRGRPEQDSTPLIVPHEGGYRLAYAVNVVDRTRGLVTRYVDAASGAPFAEVSGVISMSGRAQEELPRGEAGRAGEPSGALVSMAYVSTTGTDALGNPRPPFNVWQDSPTQFRMASNGWPGVAQVEIHDFGGADLRTDHCSGGYPYVEAATLQNGWPSAENDPDGREEISAVNNMGEAFRYLKNTFDRYGVSDNRNWLGQPVLESPRACVHGTFPGFNAVFYPSNYSWGFIRAAGGAKASAAAQDVVTHEVQHGVTKDEANLGGTFDADALNEALSDYFGTRHRGSSCLAFDAVGFCLREINSTLTLEQRRADQNCGFHCVGVAFSSSVWPVAASGADPGFDADWAIYNGLRFYMTATTEFGTGREAVIRAAKDRMRAGMNHTPSGMVYEMETQFYQRGIGPEPVAVSLPHQWICDEWHARASGTGTRSFALWFEAGAEYFNDGSVNHRFYNVSLGTFTAASLPAFTAAQLGGHRVNDGHDHTFRFRFTDVGAAVGYLDYFAPATERSCGIQTVATHDSAAALPTQFAVRQAISSSTGLISARLAASLGGSAEVAAPRAGLADQIRASGISALEVDVPTDRAGQRLEITVFDLQGRPVRTITENNVPAGRKSVIWDRLTTTGAPAPAGVYTVIVRYGKSVQRTRFVLPRSD